MYFLLYEIKILFPLFRSRILKSIPHLGSKNKGLVDTRKFLLVSKKPHAEIRDFDYVSFSFSDQCKDDKKNMKRNIRKKIAFEYLVSTRITFSLVGSKVMERS